MYKELSQYYDYIFPAGQEQLNFFKQVFGDLGVSRVLDLGCGSGNYSLEFAKWGLAVVGLDYEREMIRLARQKARRLGLSVEFIKGDMRNQEDIEGKFDAVICIGNSLPHLLTDKDLITSLTQMKEKLYRGGTLIIQTVNYDRILKGNITKLPDIVNNKAGIIFTRHYDFRPNELIDFKTTLIKKEPNGSQHSLGSTQVPLRPLTRLELENLLQTVGLVDTKFFGGYNRKPHGWDSQTTVIQTFRRKSCKLD